jgi:serine protease Do
MKRSVRPHSAACLAALAVTLSLAGCAGTTPSGDNTAAETLALGLELTGTGFFVDTSGHLLTANHAADHCARLYVEKEGRTLPADVVAQSPSNDLAVLKIRETLGLPAIFAVDAYSEANEMVFASGYQVLQGVLARGGALYNAVVAGSKDADPAADLELVSNATHGASGAPVMNANGLVIGVVTHSTGFQKVHATNGEVTKSFLAASHITFKQDSRAQLSAFQDHAHRAETISASVVCFKGK